METYDFENKHIYRDRRESAFDRMIDIPRVSRKVAYLDTKEGLDTISYLKRGYNPNNLWAVNNNPAELAHLTMKLGKMKLPRVNTVGMDFEDALFRRIPDVDMIDFDGMGCLSDKFVLMLKRITKARPHSVYGVTLLAGREHSNGGRWSDGIKFLNGRPPTGMIPLHTSFGTPFNQNHYVRLWYVIHYALDGIPEWRDSNFPPDKWPCRIHVTKMLWDVYMSVAHQPMLWVVCKCEPHKNITIKSARKISGNTKGIFFPRCI